MILPLAQDTRGRRTHIRKDTTVSIQDAGPSALVPLVISLLRTNSPPRIKRRSAFVKHLKAKHGVDIDLTKTSIEEAAAATDLLSVPPEAKKAATPPPDYTTAAKQRRYQEEDLPAFPPDAVPKLEVVTPPPAVIDVVPSSEGFCWSSAGLIGSCFHRWRTRFTLSLTGQPARRPHNARQWCCLRFPTSDTAC